MKMQKAKSLLKRGGKGFTLVELMIVIAVIALLVVVLVPRIGLIRSKAKETGVRTNALMVEGEFQSIMDDFAGSAAGAGLLEDAVFEDIDHVSGPAGSKVELRNPVTGIEGIVEYTSIGSGGAVVYDTACDNADVTDFDAQFTATKAAAAGMVAYGAYVNGTKINVKIVGYDSNGNQIAGITKILTQ